MAQANQQQRIVVTGKVKSTKDPDGLGRVQVELSGFNQAVSLPWVRVAWPYASKDVGLVVLPEEGDEVVILQGAGNSPEQMFCLGGIYNGSNRPPEKNADGKNDKKLLRTRAGHIVELSDASGGEKITVATPDGKLSLEMDHAGGKVTITSATEVRVACPSGKVVIECANAEVKASGSVSISGSSEVKLSAAQISLAGMVDLG